MLPQKLDFVKPKKHTDAFMAQFETIVDSPMDCDGFMRAGGVNISLGKLGSSVKIENTMNNITNSKDAIFVF